ncbi:hypothetical protein JCM8547_003912 [Rhodosporidiobolus lusitaniae]
MQSPAPLRHSSSGQTEFPFTATPSPRPAVTPRRSLSRGNSVSPLAALSQDQLVAHFGGDREMARKHEQDQKDYSDKQDRLVKALDDTNTLVKNLATFNQNKWSVHYPHSLGVSEDPAPLDRSVSSPPSTPSRSTFHQRHASLRRSASMFSEETAESSSSEIGSARPSPQRSFTTIDESTPLSTPPLTTPLTKDSITIPAHPLSILAIDMKQSRGATATRDLPDLLTSLSVETLSQLISRRFISATEHLSRLRTRVQDHTSRILVTGDLNAGKSTFVNALLRREVMPWDQQPCTTVFTEVIDADVNGGVEELHAIREKDFKEYDPSKGETFDRYELDEIYDVQDQAGDVYYVVRAYVKDNRAPVNVEGQEGEEPKTSNSLLKNDLVDLSLIDAPGLNRDNTSTTALFARQPDVDVVVFVVSAENHFTLSAQEFLREARTEKAHVFVVVNKWKGIRDKQRCLRMVGEQIRELSPGTWENRDELVHFVDAADYVEGSEGESPSSSSSSSDGEAGKEEPSAFEHLEQSLRSFVCLNRTRSKLAPARTYLLHLLADLSTLASTNVYAANQQLSHALLDLERIRPVVERLEMQRDAVHDGIEQVEEGVVEKVKNAAWARLERAMQFVSLGQVVPPREPAEEADRPAYASPPDSFEGPTSLPPYPGVLGIWEWANDVKKTLVRALEAEVRAAEDDARVETVEGVGRVAELGVRCLPEEGKGEGEKRVEDEGREKTFPPPSPSEEGKDTPASTARAFRPEVMFAKRRRGVGRAAARGISTGLGLGAAGGGTGISWSATDFEVSFLDLFDFDRMYSHSSAFRGGKTAKKSLTSSSPSGEEDLVETGTIVGLGLGSLGMVGSRVIGIKGTMQSLSRMVEVLGSKQARKWAGPAIGVLTVGLVVYVIIDLPRAIPRNIGRKLQLSLSSSSSSSLLPSSSSPQLEITFATAHSDRIAKETRKVLRLAGWDLRERFRAALEKSSTEKKQVEGVVARAEAALRFLAEFEERCEKEEEVVRAVEV